MKFAKISLVLSLPLLIAAATAPATQPTKLAAERAAELKKDIKNFSLQLKYHGASDKPYYNLILAVQGLQKEGGAGLSSQIRPTTAEKLIDHLATEGFLDNAIDLSVGVNRRAEATGYVLTVNGKYVEDLGFNVKMLHRLDALKPLIEENDAKKQLDILIGRLNGHRKQWEQQ